MSCGGSRDRRQPDGHRTAVAGHQHGARPRAALRDLLEGGDDPGDQLGAGLSAVDPGVEVAVQPR